jgi:hypothetical protein
MARPSLETGELYVTQLVSVHPKFPLSQTPLGSKVAEMKSGLNPEAFFL